MAIRFPLAPAGQGPAAEAPVVELEPSCRIDGFDTLPRLFLDRCQTLGDRIAHREKDLGIWQGYSWAVFLDAARAIGLGLSGIGLQRGEVVSLLSEDSKEWMYADLGIQCVGGIVCGVYPTVSAEQLAYLLRHSRSRFLIVENDEQLDKFLDIRDQVPDLVKCVVMDREGLHDYADEQVLFLDELYEMGRGIHDGDPGRFERESAKSKPEDTAILIYTSGTTGTPKGAMITHRNILAGIASGLPILSTRNGDEQLCFLPLSHVLERMVSAYAPIAAMSVVNFAESPETVFSNLQEVSPAFFTAVPRVWEKIHSAISVRAREATPLGRWAFERAVACGMARARCRMEGCPVPAILGLRFRMWDWFVLANLRRMAGLDRARRVISGAAPVSRDLVAWYWAIGVSMVEGYGLTETTGVLTGNLPERNRVGSVGPPAPGVEIRIGADGEILARGQVVFKGYWRDPEETVRTIRDGWLHTGDAGRIDDDGFVWITGRLKDVIITAGGKNISPAALENQVKFSPYISDAVVIGDRRKFLTALIMIDQDNVEKFARDHRVPFSDFASLCRAQPVIELVRTEIDVANARFARAEQIRKFQVIDRLLSPEDEELTPTMKLRRSFVERAYRELIDQMYADTRA